MRWWLNSHWSRWSRFSRWSNSTVMKKELVALMLMFSLPTMLNNRHLMQKHWTYKRKRLRSEKINQKKKINANSEGDEFSSYSEVWCQSEGRRRHTYGAERAAWRKLVQNSNDDEGKITSAQGDLEQRGLSDFLGQEKQCWKWRAVEFPEPQEEERSIGKKATWNWRVLWWLHTPRSRCAWQL